MTPYALRLAPLVPFEGGTILAAQAGRDFLPVRLMVEPLAELPPDWEVVVQRLTIWEVHQLMSAVPAEVISDHELVLDICREGQWIRVHVALQWHDPVLRRPRWWRLIKRIRRWWRLRHPVPPPPAPTTEVAVTVLGRTVP